ncbi:MAG: histidine--tRNA ligase [Bacteroidales bacterium]|nr:histidine--tRNA ligase [Bacteroidales bacterium]
MVKNEALTPKGTRDFLPGEMVKRNYVFKIIRSVFERFGYIPIETPAMERVSTLTGKYGEEGDRLLFRILNSGDFLTGISDDEILERNVNKLKSSISDKGLRYDLTVPFARFVVQHLNEITFPFKRYQIQPVWRADRPQKGRYREFFQCDVDVIGSNSLLNEAEQIQIIDEIFKKLGVKILIRINNRKILSGVAEAIGEADKMIPITIAIDKMDKIGAYKVNEELAVKGISEKAIRELQPILGLTGSVEEKLNELENKILLHSKIGRKGVDEMKKLFDYLTTFDLKVDPVFDLTLARGLDYYTGTIIEANSTEMKIGSLCGGGRYDDLTGVFGLKDVSGIGVSFGADRIYDVMEKMDKFPEETASTTTLMFVNFGEKEEIHCLSLLAEIRKSGIKAELFPDKVKIKKQMNYANKKNVEYVALVGEDEMKNGLITLKNMKTGVQSQITLDELIEEIS